MKNFVVKILLAVAALPLPSRASAQSTGYSYLGAWQPPIIYQSIRATWQQHMVQQNGRIQRPIQCHHHDHTMAASVEPKPRQRWDPIWARNEDLRRVKQLHHIRSE